MIEQDGTGGAVFPAFTSATKILALRIPLGNGVCRNENGAAV